MTILAAAMRPTIRMMQTIFAGEKVIGAIRMEDALKVLPVDLIICSLQFDESRMFEFLEAVKSNPRTRAIPFFCVRHLPSVLPARSFKGLQFACTGYGAQLVDLAAMEAQCGRKEAQKTVSRDRAESLATARHPRGARGVDLQGKSLTAR